jgi:hypothetical protein
MDVTSSLFCLLERIAAADADVVQVLCEVRDALMLSIKNGQSTNHPKGLHDSGGMKGMNTKNVNFNDGITESSMKSLIFQSLNYNSPDFQMMSSVINASTTGATKGSNGTTVNKNDVTINDVISSSSASRGLQDITITEGIELVKLFRIVTTLSSSASSNGVSGRGDRDGRGSSGRRTAHSRSDKRRDSSSSSSNNVEPEEEDGYYDDDAFDESGQFEEDQQPQPQSHSQLQPQPQVNKSAQGSTATATGGRHESGNRRKERDELLGILTRGVGLVECGSYSSSSSNRGSSGISQNQSSRPTKGNSRIRVFTVMRPEELKLVLRDGWAALDHTATLFFTDATVAVSLFGSAQGSSFDYDFDLGDRLTALDGLNGIDLGLPNALGSSGSNGGASSTRRNNTGEGLRPDSVAENPESGMKNHNESPKKRSAMALIAAQKKTAATVSGSSSSNSKGAESASVAGKLPLLEAAKQKQLHLLLCCSVDVQELGLPIPPELLEDLQKRNVKQQQVTTKKGDASKKSPARGKRASGYKNSLTEENNTFSEVDGASADAGVSSIVLEKIALPLQKQPAVQRDFIAHFEDAQKPAIMEIREQNGTGM